MSSEPSTPRPRRLAVLSPRAQHVPGAGGLFRDPPGAEPQARALEAELALLLARAPALPAPLPVGDLSLRRVGVGASTISLLLGRSTEELSFDLSFPKGAEHAEVKLRVREADQDLRRAMPLLERLGERLARSIDRARWDQAWRLARALRELPVGVPLEFYRQLVPGVEPPVGLLRTGFLCNQDCGICWQDRLWGRHDGDALLGWLEDLYALGARSLLLSGGEPTLDPRLPEYLRRARALGFETLTLETNATLCARDGLAATLRDAGLTAAFVSLHSGDEATSDAITRAPGTFARTLEGVEALLRAGIPVRFNAVLTAEGLASLPSLPDLLADRFLGLGTVQGLMLSYPTLPYRTELTAAIMPPPGPLRAALQATVRRARARGLPLEDLYGPCAPALCAFGDTLQGAMLRPVKAVPFRTHLAPCEGCAAKPYCLGVRHEEKTLFGESCTTPLAALP